MTDTSPLKQLLHLAERATRTRLQAREAKQLREGLQQLADAAQREQQLRTVVARHIYARNEGDDVDTDDLIWECQKAGISLQDDLDAIEHTEHTKAVTEAMQ